MPDAAKPNISCTCGLAVTPAEFHELVANYREALNHLRYIRTNREWGKSVLYPELDEFLEGK